MDCPKSAWALTDLRFDYWKGQPIVFGGGEDGEGRNRGCVQVEGKILSSATGLSLRAVLNGPAPKQLLIDDDSYEGTSGGFQFMVCRPGKWPIDIVLDFVAGEGLFQCAAGLQPTVSGIESYPRAVFVLEENGNVDGHVSPVGEWVKVQGGIAPHDPPAAMLKMKLCVTCTTTRLTC
jgi:hypothetical protein